VSKGTPSNLWGAIKNGLGAFADVQEHISDEQVEAIRLHVKDLLAQKFQAAKFLAHQGKFSTEDDIQLLFDACTKNDPPPVIKELTMTEEQQKFHNTPAESFRPRLPRAKTERELELEKLLATSLDILNEYSQMSMKALDLMDDSISKSIGPETRAATEAANGFIDRCKKTLES